MPPYLDSARTRLPDALASWNEDLTDALRTQNVSIRQLAAELDISDTTLYKRLRGESQWPLQQFLPVAAAFRIRLDARLNPEHLRIVELLRVLPEGAFSPANYLAGLETCARLAEAPGSSLQVSTGEVPVFYLFSNPLLTALKLYLFEHVRGQGVRRVFDPGAIDATYGQHIRQAAAIWARYRTLPREEVWGYHPFASFTNQIGSLVTEGLLDVGDVPAIAEAIAEVVRNLDDEVDASVATDRRLSLRAQRIHHTGPLYRIKCAEGTCTSFYTLHPPNFLQGVGAQADEVLAEAFALAWDSADVLTGAPGRWRKYHRRLQTAVTRLLEDIE